MTINLLMIILAFVALFLIAGYLKPHELDALFSKCLFGMGIFIFIWCFSYGVLGISSSYDVAKWCRIFGIIGIDGFLIAEVFLFSERIKNHRFFAKFFQVVIVVASFFDLFIFGNPVVSTFVRVEERTSFVANKCWQRSFHMFYIAVTMIVLILVWSKWSKQSIYQRERRSLNLIFWSNIFLVSFSIPDTVLPMFGIVSWPSSAVGGFITYVVIRYISYRYMPFDINVDALYQYMYKYADIGFMAFRLDKRLAEANAYASKIMGIEEDDNKEYYLSDLFNITPEKENEIFELLMLGEHKQMRLETRNNPKNTLVSLNVEYDDNKYEYCVIGTIVDLTKEDEMVQELYEANESKTYFLSHMSHEIRTPVNTVLGMNEMILKKAKEPRIFTYADNIKSSCNLLISIINDILDFSKIESGELSLSENEYDLRRLINDLLHMIEDRVNKKGLDMLLEIDENLPAKLYGDEIRVRQIITNLLTNAVKYTDYGSIKLRMTAESRNADFINLRIDVIDTGKGIRKEDIKKLFEEFSRVDERRNRHIEGTGLGLSITSHFVALMGGIISVDSVYGEGSDFYVILPQKIIGNDVIGNINENNNSFEAKREVNKLVRVPNGRVLIVDDNEMNLTVAGLILEETNMNIDLSDNGEDALDKMRSNKYDIIFLDHMMPKMDGIELRANMKKESLQVGVPVIVLTANAIAGAKEMYLKNGFDDYMSKPIEVLKINEMLLKHLPSSMIIDSGLEVTE